MGYGAYFGDAGESWTWRDFDARWDAVLRDDRAAGDSQTWEHRGSFSQPLRGGSGDRRRLEGSGPTVSQIRANGYRIEDTADWRVRAAAHEAAHAVVAHRLGIDVAEVSIADANGGAYTRLRFDPADTSDVDRLAVAIAGHVVERAAGWTVEGCESDDAAAADLEARMSTADIALAAGTADRILSDHRAELAVVAYGLLGTTGPVEGRSITNTIDKASTLDPGVVYSALPPLLQALWDYDGELSGADLGDPEDDPEDYMGPTHDAASDPNRAGAPSVPHMEPGHAHPPTDVHPDVPRPKRVPGQAVSSSEDVPHVFTPGKPTRCVVCGKTKAEGPHVSGRSSVDGGEFRRISGIGPEGHPYTGYVDADGVQHRHYDVSGPGEIRSMASMDYID
jgi:hypothetical protein